MEMGTGNLDHGLGRFGIRAGLKTPQLHLVGARRNNADYTEG